MLAEQILGRRFADRELLRLALTHPSAAENGAEGFYERLEFLGDSLLGFIIAEETFKRFPDMREGGMTRIKVSLVAGSVLSAAARDLGLADAIIVGRSERGTGGRGLKSALENTFEALTAAIYLDAGIDAAREWVLETLGHLITEETADSPENPKSALQELVQAKGASPEYRTVGEEGPPHDRTFSVEVFVDDKRIGSGVGRTKREAEAAAAAAGLKKLARRRSRGSGKGSIRA
ncbi:MAG: ribonuclease III [Coriobacteriia bacterium]|nr:ribonuclease III [Coriobacteriia bacterium]